MFIVERTCNISMSSLREQLQSPKLCKVRSVARPSKWVLSSILLENRKYLLVILQHLARCCSLCYLFSLFMRTVCFLTQLLVIHFFFLMSAFSFFQKAHLGNWLTNSQLDFKYNLPEKMDQPSFLQVVDR